jgi:hypothetical protein
LKKMMKLKTSNAKKDKNKRKYELLKQHPRTAKMEFAKRQQGTYQSGMNVDDLFGELLNGGEVPPAAKRTKKTRKYYPFCGKTGHTTRRAKTCKVLDKNT